LLPWLFGVQQLGLQEEGGLAPTFGMKALKLRTISPKEDYQD